eukprot:TRINITY_DN4398_c0_g3_i1.p1 TRINITY_DN4398_c0_g3~~TRINITY_DN4398_c0_g3_i1.p1  ORF type:complete len:855 (+),score=167.20 TRINITY_DN4398_c0_g3_i1:144-2708(+)
MTSLCLNTKMVLPQCCCSKFVGDNQKTYNPDNPDQVELTEDATEERRDWTASKLDRLDEAYQEAVRRRDYQEAKNVEKMRSQIKNQDVDADIDGTLLHVALLNVALQLAVSRNEFDVGKLISTELEDKFDDLKRLSKVKDKLNYKTLTGQEAETMDFLVSGAFPNVESNSTLEARAEELGLNPQVVRLGPMAGLLLIVQRNTSDEAEPEPEEVIAVFRPGAYIRAYKVQHLRAWLKKKRFHGMDDQSKDAEKLRKKFKSKLCEPLWSLAFDVLYEATRRSINPTQANVRLQDEHRTITVRKNAVESVELICNNPTQARELYDALKLASRFEITVGAHHRDFTTIQEAIQHSSKERCGTILVDPGIYQENVVIDRQVLLKPAVRKEQAPPLPGVIPEKLAEGLVIIQPDFGSAISIVYMPPKAHQGQEDDAGVTIEDIALRGNYDEASVTQTGTEEISESANAVVDYGKDLTLERDTALCAASLIRCDIGHGPVGVLASGSGAQKMILSGCSVHSTQYAGVLVQNGGNIRVIASAIRDNFGFGMLASGAKSLLVLTQTMERPKKGDLFDKDSNRDNDDNRKCLLHRNAHLSANCFVCCDQPYPSPHLANVLSNNSGQAVIVNESARLEMYDAWVYANNISVTGNGTSAKIHNCLLWMYTHPVAVSCSFGSTVKLTQNLSNRQLVSVEGQCHVNGQLSTAVQEYNERLRDSRNVQPGMTAVDRALGEDVTRMIQHATHVDSMKSSPALKRGIFYTSTGVKQPPPFSTGPAHGGVTIAANSMPPLERMGSTTAHPRNNPSMYNNHNTVKESAAGVPRHRPFERVPIGSRRGCCGDQLVFADDPGLAGGESQSSCVIS